MNDDDEGRAADAMPLSQGTADCDASLSQLLAALASDAAALAHTIVQSISDGDSDDAKQLQLQTIVSFLQQVDDLKIVDQVAVSLLERVSAAYASESVDETVVLLLLLLDEVLRDVAPRTSEPTVLLAFFRLATTRLRAEALEEQECAMLLQWCDVVLKRVFATAAMLLALHDARAEQSLEPTAASFRVQTLVWKNLTKLSTAFQRALASASVDAEEQSVPTDATTGESLTTARFHVDDLLASVIAAMEHSAQQLSSRSTAQTDAMTALKFLRLYWRAFQGQLLCFVSVLTSEVESSVMALVHVAASLVSVLQCAVDASARMREDTTRLLDMVLALASKLGSDASVSAAAREQLRVLLWHDASDMVRAIAQRREAAESSPPTPSDADSAPLDAAIRLGHALALAAFSSSDANVLPASDRSEDIGGAKVLTAARKLLERFETCTRVVPLPLLRATTGRFVDALLALLLRVDDVAALQLFLIEQLGASTPSQRLLVLHDVWRECLCYGWSDPIAADALQTLLQLAQARATDSRNGVALHVQRAVYDLVAFVFAELSVSLQRQCLDAATAVIDAVFSDGPAHEFTCQVASQLRLLEALAAASFLRHWRDDAAKEQWVAKYLPMALECCGTVLDLLNSDDPLAPDERSGMMRILDAGLLVVKGVLDDSDAVRSDLDELASMLVPMSLEVVTQLRKAMANRVGIARPAAPKTLGLTVGALAREARCTRSRMLETSLFVLTVFGAVLKRNERNQCAVALQDLAQLLASASPLENASGAAAAVAWFIKTTLADVQVASGDVAVVAQLFVQLFQTLTADAGADKTPPLHVTLALDAFYRFLAHSNVASLSATSASPQRMLHECAHTLFRALIATKRLSASDVASAIASELTLAASRTQTTTSSRSNGGSGEASDRKRRGVDSMVVDDIDESDYEAALEATSCGSAIQPPSKRQKLDVFVALCRRAHEAFVAQTASASFLESVTPQELDDAVHVLEQLLMRRALS